MITHLSRRAALYRLFSGPTLPAAPALRATVPDSPFARSRPTWSTRREPLAPLLKCTTSTTGRPAYCVTSLAPTDLPHTSR